MKKRILFFYATLTLLSFISCGHNDQNNFKEDLSEDSISEEIASNTQVEVKVNNRIFTDFIYDVGPRFGAIKKSDLDKAETIDAFFDSEEIDKMETIKSVSIILTINDEQFIINDEQSNIREISGSSKLTDAQRRLLQSSNYSTNFLIKTEYQQKNTETGLFENSYSSLYLTIVPEKQATYLNGRDKLIEYLKINTEDVRANVQADKLLPAKLFFTVTKNGTIENVKQDRTSGYPLIDKKMIELITKTTNNWVPAENLKGEKVNQELVVSFGLMGC
jgi:hypothetical protein